MSSVTTPEAVAASSTPSPSSTLTTEINTGAEIAAGVAAAIPGGQPVALGIGAAAAIADLVVHITSMYSQKIITAAQLTAMVKIAVSGFDSAVAAWDAAAPKNVTVA